MNLVGINLRGNSIINFKNNYGETALTNGTQYISGSDTKGSWIVNRLPAAVNY